MVDEPLSVAQAARRAGVSTDTIRRAYRSGALPAYRPGGTRVVIRLEDLDEWAFSETTRVAPPASGRLRPADDGAAPARRPARRTSHRASAPGSVERLLEIERSA